MGNTGLKRTCTDVRVRLDGSGGESMKSQNVVTVMKEDGTAMEFAREFTVFRLLKDFPGHFVCNAEELGSVGKAKMLSRKTLLKLGKTYFVIPQHQKQKRKAGSKCSKVNPLVSSHGPDSKPQEINEEEEGPPGRIRILMTKRQLAKMLSDGSILIPGSMAAYGVTNMSAKVKVTEPWYCSMRLFNHPQAVQNICASSERNWSPELDCIVEVPSQ